MFVSDMIITKAKSNEFARDMIACYRKMLEEEEYTCDVEFEPSGVSIHGTFKGLNLSDEILYKIYHENPKRFLEGKFLK